MKLERSRGTLRYVTREEISIANRHPDDPSVNRDKTSFWPDHRTNLSLKSQLCEDVPCETCDIKCGFGKEYLKRVETGRMAPIRKAVAV